MNHRHAPPFNTAAGGPSLNGERAQGLPLLPELSPDKPLVNKNQLAVISMWICGMPC